MIRPRVTVRQRPLRRRLLVGAAPLLLAIMAAIVFAASSDFRSRIGNRLGVPAQPRTAYTFVAGRIARIDPATGAVLAESSDVSRDQFPSIAATHDGRSLFFLDTVAGDDGRSDDRLVQLSADTFAPVTSVPLQHFMRSMDGWPPALAVTADDRTVVVEQYGNTQSDPYWLSYFDIPSGRLSTDVTLLRRRGFI